MANPLITSNETPALSESKVGHIKDLLNPIIRRFLKNDKQAQAVIEAGGKLQDRFAAVLIDMLVKLTNTFMVTVDYTRSLSGMVKAGHYYEISHQITAEHFPVRGEGKVDLEIRIVHFNCYMSTDDVLKELDQLGLRPVTLPELLAFGEMHSAVQTEFPIAALGSMWSDKDGNRAAVFLCGRPGLRMLKLNYDNRSYIGSDWQAQYRFAAVSK